MYEKAVAVFPYAFDSNGNRYDASAGSPPAADYLDSIVPQTTEYTIYHKPAFECLILDTTSGSCRVTAVPWVEVESGEARGFSCWIRQSGLDFVYDRTLTVKAGEEGWIGLVYQAEVPVWATLHPSKSKPWGPTWWMRLAYQLFKLLPPPTPPKRLRPDEELLLAKQLDEKVADLKGLVPSKMPSPPVAEKTLAAI